MENKSVTLAAQVLAPAVSEIRSLLEASRKNVAQQVNQELLSTYWKIGEIVVRCEQNDSIRAAYGEKTLSQLSGALTKELGKGFSRSNVYNMRQFYLSYPIFQTVSGKLSWSHYCELLSISDKEKRSFYEKEAVNSGWSVREMKRQVESSLFERLLLSRGDANKEQVLALAEKGVDYTKPEDIIKDPYVFEFLGLPEEKSFLESDLEAALVRQIEDFLLELGRGFMFVGTQQRVTVNNTHYYVDMVFYNKICNGVQREHNKKLNNGLPILHKVPPKRDYGRYFCIMAEKGGTSHGGLTEKLSPFFHAKKQEVNAYGR